MTFTIDKRRLPPINLLIAFEAAARLGSFAQAGTEVHLSASAISRQVKSLEEHLDVKLFERVRQRVQLTEAGRFLAVQLGRLLTVVDQASQLRNVSHVLALLQPEAWESNRNRPEEYASLKVPALIICSVDDPNPDYIKSARDMAALVPRARLVDMPHVAHWPQFEDPDTFNPLFVRFMQEGQVSITCVNA